MSSYQKDTIDDKDTKRLTSCSKRMKTHVSKFPRESLILLHQFLNHSILLLLRRLEDDDVLLELPLCRVEISLQFNYS